MVPFFKTKDGLTFFVDGQHYFIKPENDFHSDLLDALRRGADGEELLEIMGELSIILNWSDGTIGFSGDGVYLLDSNGEAIKESKFADGMLKRLKEYMDDRLPYTNLINFWRRCMQHPDEDSKQQLFRWLEAQSLPITETGMFIAYKTVTRLDDGRLVDTYTKSIANDPGCEVTMLREDVTKDPNQTCSAGLHVASWDYAKNSYGHYSDPVVACLVDPVDVVSIPVDYNADKIRVCRYIVLSVIEKEHKSKAYQVNQEASISPTNNEVYDALVSGDVYFDTDNLTIGYLKGDFKLSDLKALFKETPSYASVDQGYGHFLRILKGLNNDGSGESRDYIQEYFDEARFANWVDDAYDNFSYYFLGSLDEYDVDDDEYDDDDDDDYDGSWY